MWGACVRVRGGGGRTPTGKWPNYLQCPSRPRRQWRCGRPRTRGPRRRRPYPPGRCGCSMWGTDWLAWNCRVGESGGAGMDCWFATSKSLRCVSIVAVDVSNGSWYVRSTEPIIFHMLGDCRLNRPRVGEVQARIQRRARAYTCACAYLRFGRTLRCLTFTCM